MSALSEVTAPLGSVDSTTDRDRLDAIVALIGNRAVRWQRLAEDDPDDLPLRERARAERALLSDVRYIADGR